MQTESKFFDDLARLATGAMGSLQAAREELDLIVRQRIERLLDGMDLVRREEFEVVKEMAAAARLENEKLARRLAALEAAPAAKKSVPRRTTGAGRGKSTKKVAGKDAE